MMRNTRLGFRKSGQQALLVLMLIAPAHQAGGAPAATPPVEAFAELPALRSLRPSPDGRHLAMLKNVDGNDAPVILRIESGRPESAVRIEAVDGAEEVIGLAWGGDRHLLISALGRRPNASPPESRLYVYSLETGRVEPALQPPRPGGHSLRARRASRQRAPSLSLIDPLPQSPGKALISQHLPGEREASILHIDLASGNYVTVLEKDGGLRNVHAGPEGALRLATQDRASGPRYVLRSGTGDVWRDLGADLSPERGDVLFGFTPDGGGLHVLRPRGRGRQFMRFDLDTKTLRDAMPTPRDIDLAAILFDRPPPSGRPVGFRIAGDFRRDVYLDANWRAIQRAIDRRFEGTVNSIVDSDRAGRLHVVRAAHGARPDVFYLYDSMRRQAVRLGSAQPALAGVALPEKRLIRYPARDGVEIPAYLTLPLQGSRPWPAVVMPHGGPHSRIFGDFSYWAQFLASRGYAVIEANFRGSSGYGQDWEDAGRGEWGGLMQDDIDDGARWLLSEGLAAPGRLCIMGGSFGGYAALMGVARAETPYACAIAINAATDLEQLISDDLDRYPDAAWTRFVGHAVKGDRRLDAVSPVHLADRISVPVLLFHARDDLRLPPEHSRKMARAMRDAGGRVTYIRADHGGHPLASSKARRRLLREVEIFLERHMPEKALDGSSGTAAP